MNNEDVVSIPALRDVVRCVAGPAPNPAALVTSAHVQCDHCRHCLLISSSEQSMFVNIAVFCRLPSSVSCRSPMSMPGQRDRQHTAMFPRCSNTWIMLPALSRMITLGARSPRLGNGP